MNDPYIIAANLERCAIGWRIDADWYTGRRRAWRLERAEALMDRAWALIE